MAVRTERSHIPHRVNFVLLPDFANSLEMVNMDVTLSSFAADLSEREAANVARLPVVTYAPLASDWIALVGCEYRRSGLALG